VKRRQAGREGRRGRREPASVVEQDKAAQVVEALMAPEMYTGWGIRTLASSMGAYNPVSYHNGSVWPHDTTLAAAGMMRCGFVEEAQSVAHSLLEAAGRLPELFCGLDRGSYAVPVPYPASCSPQAWASAAPVHLIRLLLRFDPILIWNELWLAPPFPRERTSVWTTSPLPERPEFRWTSTC
jgi:glycogen debranching enzyme